MILEKIKQANVEAIKNKDSNARSIYSVVINKLMLENIKKREKGETLSEGEELNIIAKTLKELEDEKLNYSKAGNAAQVDAIKRQMEILSAYLPKMLSDDEIRAEINKLDDKSLPSVMKYFKSNFNGKCDMRRVQEIVKGL